MAEIKQPLPMADCAACGKRLPTATEIGIGQCVTCVLRARGELATVITEKSQLIYERDSALEQVRRLEKFLASVESRREARRLGELAHEQGSSLEENPFLTSVEEHLEWRGGFMLRDLAALLKRIEVESSWATEMLGHIQELARGYGQEEIAQKLDIVIQKLGLE